MPLLIPKPLTKLLDIKSSYVKEREVAISAVVQASIVAQKVFKSLVNEETITKKDKSPVTVGDYTAQALVNLIISHHFPSDLIVGEEDSIELRESQQQEETTNQTNTNLSKIIDLSNSSLSTSLNFLNDETSWTELRGTNKSENEWLDVIDKGNSLGGLKSGRMWTLDPIDGTKGFLRGGQYAVCLALIVDGKVVLGVMGTPNLPLTSDSSKTGTLFIAEKGQGAYQRALFPTKDEPVIYEQIMMNPRSIESLRSEGTFCESVEAGHSDQELNARIVKELEMVKGLEPVRMDSQAKYASIARGDGDVYLRFPTRLDYEEKIWDHAAGSLIVEESGGKVTDMQGKILDFSIGRTLKKNKGILACHSNLHTHILNAVIKVSNFSPPKK